MSDNNHYLIEIIYQHILVCEKRFAEIKSPADFVSSEYGNTLLDSIVTRLQSIGENIKSLLKNNHSVFNNHPEIEWDKIIRFRDFISHHYEMLDYEIIFEICKNDLPKLKHAIESNLNAK